MNNLNFFTNSYFHCDPQLSQHVDTTLTRNVWSTQSVPILPTNGYNTNLWPFSGTLGATSITTVTPSQGNNNEESTTATTQPIYAWMKKRRSKTEKLDELTEGKQERKNEKMERKSLPKTICFSRCHRSNLSLGVSATPTDFKFKYV